MKLFPLPLLILFCLTATAAEPTRFVFEGVEMAVTVRFVIFAEEEETAKNAANAGFKRFRELNAIMSDYDSDSELSLLSTKPIKTWIPLSDDLFDVMQTAREIGTQSEGAFDISVGPMVRLWRRARRMKELPKQEYIDHAKNVVGLDKWELDPETKSIRLHKEGMRFDLGGIAKGYATDEAAKRFRASGVEIFLIDAGGDLYWGKTPKEGFKVMMQSSMITVTIPNKGMATSGDTYQHVEIDGRRYSHLVDPKTGMGLTESSIVSVLATTGMEADALASAVSVLGPEKGMAFIKKRKNTSCQIVFQSENWPFSQ